MTKKANILLEKLAIGPLKIDYVSPGKEGIYVQTTQLPKDILKEIKADPKKFNQAQTHGVIGIKETGNKRMDRLTLRHELTHYLTRNKWYSKNYKHTPARLVSEYIANEASLRRPARLKHIRHPLAAVLTVDSELGRYPKRYALGAALGAAYLYHKKKSK
jgi:hypothetical protein